MAPITPAIVLQRLQMKKTTEIVKTTTPRREPVRVKLQRVNAGFSETHPPDGQAEIWWARLKEALGTTSSDFVNASLFQLQRAAQLPLSGISELAMNASLALIEAAPRHLRRPQLGSCEPSRLRSRRSVACVTAVTSMSGSSMFTSMTQDRPSLETSALKRPGVYSRRQKHAMTTTNKRTNKARTLAIGPELAQ